jgi:hypothetical protein
MLLDNCNSEEARALAEKLHWSASALDIPHPGSASGHVQLRFGITAHPARHFATARAAARMADESTLKISGNSRSTR